MNQIIDIHRTEPNASIEIFSHTRIAIVSAMWHHDIVNKAQEGLIAELNRHEFPTQHVDQFEVPGAFEIPVFIKKLIQKGQYSAIIACALIVDGGIYRHEFVATAVINGLMQLQIESGTPVISAVLTPKDFHEHLDHHNFFKDHFVKKGTEAANACLSIIAAHKKLNQ